MEESQKGQRECEVCMVMTMGLLKLSCNFADVLHSSAQVRIGMGLRYNVVLVQFGPSLGSLCFVLSFCNMLL
jgi:hypothetical protein